MRPLPLRTTSAMPKRLSRSPESRTSSSKSIAVRRLAPPPWPLSIAQLPLEVKVASGVIRFRCASRHSRRPSLVVELRASTSMRPRSRSRSSKSCTTISSAGRLRGSSSSRSSARPSRDCGRFNRSSRAKIRPGAGTVSLSSRYSISPLNSSAVAFTRHRSLSRATSACTLCTVRPPQAMDWAVT
ncbi:hypothetical protein SDC9_128504 [bioreactor metagenome]|uniref:Uncharacterized protein n=1 Tax=bioreactor metagenome TaxID=1076179 RepID=A0A645CX18_9ZZZZ